METGVLELKLKSMIEKEQVLESTSLPELGVPGGGFHKGKVRDNYWFSDTEGIQITTDRISAGDVVMDSQIPLKGALFTDIVQYWADKIDEEGICGHHVKGKLTDNALLVERTDDLGIEVIVRGYLTGSAWRDYNKPADKESPLSPTNNVFYEKYGISITSDMVEGGVIKKNVKLKEPIVTPTTKEEGDPGKTKEALIEYVAGYTGISLEQASKVVEYTYQKSVEVFEFTAQELEKKQKIIVDTKYEWGFKRDADEFDKEFGFTRKPITDENIKEKVILIDEFNTSDSSRFWEQSTYQERMDAGKEPDAFDKEYLRTWLQDNGLWKEEGVILPVPVRVEVAKRYCEAFEFLTDGDLAIEFESGFKLGEEEPCPIGDYAIARDEQQYRETINDGYTDITNSEEDLLKGYFVSIIAGSGSDIGRKNESTKSPVEKIQDTLTDLGICHGRSVASGHRDPEGLFELVDWIDEFSDAGGKVVYIDVTGMSNGKGPTLAGRTLNPVIHAYDNKGDKDTTDLASSINTPPGVPLTTANGAKNAALAAGKILGLTSLDIRDNVEAMMQAGVDKVEKDNAQYARVWRPSEN